MLDWAWKVLKWPIWASSSCLFLLSCLVCMHFIIDPIVHRLLVSKNVSNLPDNSKKQTQNLQAPKEFKSFQRQYLTVYFLVMFADWLQGTHMYTLYQSYNVNVGQLFLTGFLSSAIFGNVVGPIVDKYGRKKACIVYCILEIIINLLENVPRMDVLIVGRVLGGISTSLLFSAFESWMVTEHHRHGFQEEALAKTFAIASEGNGMIAVIAGLIAQVSADYFGEIGPFHLAVVTTILAMGFVTTWTENYGGPKETKKNQHEVKGTSTDNIFCIISKDTRIWSLGMCYSLFDGVMYIFVFLWFPTLQQIVPDGILPSGLVFSSFMLCISIGGKFFEIFRQRVSEETFAILLCLCSCLGLSASILSNEYWLVLYGFFLFEACIGAFFPCSATLRSRIFPDQNLGTMLSLFRLPTNILVVLGTAASDYLTQSQLYKCCNGFLLLGAVCGIILQCASRLNSTTTQSGQVKKKQQ